MYLQPCLSRCCTGTANDWQKCLSRYKYSSSLYVPLWCQRTLEGIRFVLSWHCGEQTSPVSPSAPCLPSQSPGLFLKKPSHCEIGAPTVTGNSRDTLCYTPEPHARTDANESPPVPRSHRIPQAGSLAPWPGQPGRRARGSCGCGPPRRLRVRRPPPRPEGGHGLRVCGDGCCGPPAPGPQGRFDPAGGEGPIWPGPAASAAQPEDMREVQLREMGEVRKGTFQSPPLCVAFVLWVGGARE